MSSLIAFLKSDEGPAAVEYAVMLAAILLVAIVGVSALGGANGALFGNIDSQMQSHGIK